MWGAVSYTHLDVYKRQAVNGDTVQGSMMAGQVAGLIHDIVPAGEIVRRTVDDAEALLGRLCDLSLIHI